MVYIQTIFSSDLIRLAGSVPTGQGSNHFVVSREFWIYPLLTFSLMVFTVVPAKLWERWQS